MKIGIISDTHGKLPGKVFHLFKDVEAILHAGDVGREDILQELETIAPLYAVHGNVDDFKIRNRCPLWRVEIFWGKKILITHIIAPLTPAGLAHAFQKIGCETNPDVLVYGHTHEQCIQKVGDILTINPGSAGDPRSNRPASIAFLEIENNGRMQAWLQNL